MLGPHLRNKEIGISQLVHAHLLHIPAGRRGGLLRQREGVPLPQCQRQTKTHKHRATAARMAASWRRTSGECEWELAGFGMCEPGLSLLVAEGRGSGHARRHRHSSLSPPDSGREGCRRRGESVCTSEEGREGKRGSRHGRLAVRRLGISHGHSPRRTAEAMKKGPWFPWLGCALSSPCMLTHTLVVENDAFQRKRN